MIRTISLERLRLVRFPDDLGRWLVALLFAGLAIQTARLLWVLIVPVGPLGDWRPASPAPLSADAQSAIFASAGPFGGTNPASAAAATLPNDLKLFGVRSASGGLRGGAIVQLPDGQQVSVSVGEAVLPGIELVAVGFDYADVLRDGGRQRLFLDQDKTPETIAGTGAPGAPPNAGLAAAVSLSPRGAGGSLNGVIVAPGADPAAFARTGLRAGDVIVAVNGVQVASLEDLAQLQRSLGSAASLSLRVERDGAVIPVVLNTARNP